MLGILSFRRFFYYFRRYSQRQDTDTGDLYGPYDGRPKRKGAQAQAHATPEGEGETAIGSPSRKYFFYQLKARFVA